MADQIRRFDHVQVALVILTLGLAILVAIILHRHEIRRARDLVAIEEARRIAEKNERWLATTMESMGDAVIITDPEGAVSYMNPVAERLTGWLIGDARERHLDEVFRIVNEDSGEAVESPVSRVIRERVVVGLANHTKLIARDGRHIPIADSGAPILGANERLLGVVLVFHDVSHERESELRLRASEERLSLALEATKDGLWDWNLTTGAVYFSPSLLYNGRIRAQRLFPHSFEEWESRVHPEDRETTVEAVRQAMEPGHDSFTCEFRFRRADGEWMWILGRGKVVEHDAEGRPSRMAGTHTDVTARKSYEQELDWMRAYLRNIFDSMPSVLVGVDPEGKVTHWNTQAEELTGLMAVEAYNRPVQEVLPGFRNQIELLRKAMTERRPQVNERVKNSTADQSGPYWDVTVFPLTTNGIEGAVIRLDDVTARVRIEEMMIQNEKMMTVGGLAAGMAHEINNPLGGILQGAQNIQRRLSPRH